MIDLFQVMNHPESELFQVVNIYSPNDFIGTSILMISCYGIYLLSLYWFVIINKLLYKNVVRTFFKNLDSDRICQWICTYIYFGNLFVCFYVYKDVDFHILRYLVDTFGVLTLSVSSYIYHNEVYHSIVKNKVIDYIYPLDDNLILYLNDNMGIHLRSHFAVITSYYFSNSVYLIGGVSFFIHIHSIYFIIQNVTEYVVDKNYPKEYFFYKNNVLLAVPIMIDTLFVLLNMRSEYRIPYLFVNITLGLVVAIEPFYKLNHVAMHLLFIAQTYYMCQSFVNDVDFI